MGKRKRLKRRRAKDIAQLRLNREAELLRLGFSSYSEYLKSDLWKEIKQRVLASRGLVCEICSKNKATIVHHKSYGYATLSGRFTDKLVAVCGRCHFSIEFDRGEKVSIAESSLAIDRVRRSLRKRTEGSMDLDLRSLKDVIDLVLDESK